MIRFYGEELLAPRPTPKLEDHSLSAVRDCLFNIYSQLPSIPLSATWGRAMPWWQRPTYYMDSINADRIYRVFQEE